MERGVFLLDQASINQASRTVYNTVITTNTHRLVPRHFIFQTPFQLGGFSFQGIELIHDSTTVYGISAEWRRKGIGVVVVARRAIRSALNWCCRRNLAVLSDRQIMTARIKRILLIDGKKPGRCCCCCCKSDNRKMTKS